MLDALLQPAAHVDPAPDHVGIEAARVGLGGRVLDHGVEAPFAQDLDDPLGDATGCAVPARVDDLDSLHVGPPRPSSLGSIEAAREVPSGAFRRAERRRAADPGPGDDALMLSIALCG